MEGRNVEFFCDFFLLQILIFLAKFFRAKRVQKGVLHGKI
jgi:hypothetical protein